MNLHSTDSGPYSVGVGSGMSLLSLSTQLLVNGLAVFVTAYVLPGIMVDSFLVALVTAVLLGVVNTFVRPLLIILTLPITIVTLGVFLLVLNALLVVLVAMVVPGFTVTGLGWALAFSVVLSLVSGFFSVLQRN